MDEILTMEEIKARYAPDWVIIAEPVVNENSEVLGGKVILHGPDHDELYRKLMPMKIDRIAVRYLGEMPSGEVAFNL